MLDRNRHVHCTLLKWERLYATLAQELPELLKVMTCQYPGCTCQAEVVNAVVVQQFCTGFFQQELNPNVEAKLSYLLKFVQKSVEGCNQKEEPTFTINEVG